MSVRSPLPGRQAEQARIRPALPGDMAQLLALEWSRPPGERIERSQLRHLLTQGHALTLVDEYQGRIRGDVMLLFRRDSDRARLLSLTSHPDWRRKGVARGLLQAAEQAAGILARSHLWLDVPDTNLLATQWFLGHGYRPYCDRPLSNRAGDRFYRLEKNSLPRPAGQRHDPRRWAFSLANDSTRL